MTQHEALLRAVLVNPADDLPRLVYADWLEENGQADRAAFIRCHVEEERLRHTHRHGHPGGCRKCKLVRRLCRWIESDEGGKAVFRDTFGPGRGVWFGGRELIAHPAALTSPAMLFDRGMVGGLRCSLADWEKHEASLVAAHPIEMVTLTDRRPHLEPATERWGWFAAWRAGRNAPSLDATIPVGPLMMLMARNAAANGVPVTESSRWFPTEKAACRALSASLIDLARIKAGLPLLTAPTSPNPEPSAVAR